MRVVTPEEMARADRATIEEHGVPGVELMERAGEAVTRAAFEMFNVTGGRAVVWSGKGNNGGDGSVVARLLDRAGARVRLVLLSDPGELTGDAALNFSRLQGTGVEVAVAGGAGGAAEVAVAGGCDLAVDAIFGTGFSGRAAGVHEKAIAAINDSPCPVLSIDIPSGVDGLTGAVSGPAVRADRTVTFAALKVGLVQYPGAELTGELEVADIGIPESVLEASALSRIELLGEREADALLPARLPYAHKRQAGSLLVAGGSPGLTGAAVLCSRAALRAGAGLVTLAVPEGLSLIFEIKTTEAMTAAVPQTGERTISVAGARRLLEMCGSHDALAVGPGASTVAETAEAVRLLMASARLPVVLDADGINAFAGRADELARRECPTVITPHPGEMAALLETSPGDVQADRVGTARGAAGRFECVVVLKGANTVVAEPAGRVRIIDTGNPGMATAGMGDVLTGCVGALLAQGADPFDAASAGAWFHGLAGDIAGGMGGMIGMTAGDVAEALPLALRKRFP